MDGSHADENPIPNRHIVELSWYHTEFTLLTSLGGRWDLELDLPFDVKVQDVRFETPDGAPFDNPAGLIHHRDETLQGIGDMKVLGNLRPTSVLAKGDLLTVGMGLSLPTGKIEENPYELGALGIRHRHIQFGTGTIDPVLRLGYLTPVGKWRLDASLDFQLSLYETRHGYRGPLNMTFNLGPNLNLGGLGVGLQYSGWYQGRAKWDGQTDPNSGYFVQGIRLSASIPMDPSWSVRFSATWLYDADTRPGADQFTLDWLFGISVAYSPKATDAGEMPGRLRPPWGK